jgi:hypothetical protein
MTRAARSLVIPFVALLVATLVAPASVAASAPSAATLTIQNASCSGAPGTIAVGDTVCARAVVTVTGTGAGEYRTHWYAPGAFSPTFQDVHPVAGAGSYTFTDAHAMTAGGVWTVRACKTAGCASAASIADTETFTVSTAVVATPTSLAVSPASGTYAGSVSLVATLTTSAGSAVSGANVSFTLRGTGVGSAVTDPTGVATLTGVSLGTNDAGGYATGVGASFAGTATTAASSGSGSLSIARASSTTDVTCSGGPFTFDGTPIEPCSASVTGVGGLSLVEAPGYADNVDAGTATASYAFAGDTNHLPSSDAETFTIGRASSTTVVTCPAGVFYTGSPQTPCTASASGAGGLDAALDVAYADNVIGTATASASFSGDANHDGSSASTTFVIGFAWTGFDEPIAARGHGAAGKGFNAGQTIPVKFALWDAAGDPVLLYGTPTFNRSGNLGSCAGTPADGVAPAAGPDAGAAFGWTGFQYHHNWSTKGLTPGLYRIFADLADGTRHYQDVCLTN